MNKYEKKDLMLNVSADIVINTILILNLLYPGNRIIHNLTFIIPIFLWYCIIAALSGLVVLTNIEILKPADKRKFEYMVKKWHKKGKWRQRYDFLTDILVLTLFAFNGFWGSFILFLISNFLRNSFVKSLTEFKRGLSK
ncbi:MAG: hypothetical protein J5598_01495 [Clostridia bacterium]|jgi:hypothetical protein|nr:hypothetical protein [Clostridia bacterium]